MQKLKLNAEGRELVALSKAANDACEDLQATIGGDLDGSDTPARRRARKRWERALTRLSSRSRAIARRIEHRPHGVADIVTMALAAGHYPDARNPLCGIVMKLAA